MAQQGTAAAVAAAGGEISPSSSLSFPSRTSSLDHHSALSKQESMRSMNNNNSHGTGGGSGASAITAHTGSIRSLASLGSVRSEMYSLSDAVDRSLLTRNSSASSGTGGGGGGGGQTSVSSRSTAEVSFHTATSMDEEIY